jgi:hypothetical protein
MAEEHREPDSTEHSGPPVARAAEARVRIEEATYKACNPTTGGPATASGCDDYLLNVEGSPQSVGAERRDAESERRALVTRIEEINTELTRREELARLECNGTKEDGTTGIVGEGPNCVRNRDEADRYRASSNLDEHQAALVALNEKITGLIETEGEASLTYAGARRQRQASREAYDGTGAARRGLGGRVDAA